MVYRRDAFHNLLFALGKGSRKKKFSGPALPPPPNLAPFQFFSTFKKSYFFLVARHIKKELFCGFPNECQFSI